MSLQELMNIIYICVSHGPNTIGMFATRRCVTEGLTNELLALINNMVRQRRNHLFGEYALFRDTRSKMSWGTVIFLSLRWQHYDRFLFWTNHGINVGDRIYTRRGLTLSSALRRSSRCKFDPKCYVNKADCIHLSRDSACSCRHPKPSNKPAGSNLTSRSPSH